MVNDLTIGALVGELVGAVDAAEFHVSLDYPATLADRLGSNQTDAPDDDRS